MSTGKGHIFFGFIISFIFIFVISNYFFKPDLKDIILYIVIGVLFSMWPDIDTKSKGQRFFYSIFFLTDCYLIWLQEFKIAAFFGLLIILPILAKHRGWTHSRPAMLLIPLPILLYPMWVNNSLDFSNLPFYAIAVTGYFSHLLIDGKLL